MRLEDAIGGYLLFKASRASPDAIQLDRSVPRRWAHWQGDCQVGDLTSDDLRRYIAHEADRGLAPHTVHRTHGALCALLTWLSSPDIELIDGNPMRLVPRPKLPRLKPKSLSEEAIKRLMEAAKEGRNVRRDRAIIRFLLDTGARASGLCGTRMNGC
jgi:site-specific recombinase XerD